MSHKVLINVGLVVLLLATLVAPAAALPAPVTPLAQGAGSAPAGSPSFAPFGGGWLDGDCEDGGNGNCPT